MFSEYSTVTIFSPCDYVHLENIFNDNCLLDVSFSLSLSLFILCTQTKTTDEYGEEIYFSQESFDEAQVFSTAR